MLHDGSDHNDLSENEQRNDMHLHIRKDICRTDVHLRLKNSSDLYAVTSSPAFAGNISGTQAKHSGTLIFRSNPRTGLSGLSPPVA
ncbi:MAG: hypothetical protein C0402_12205 [Thermodesulfovibrio sp.]|nr:hypothetical protein [Thermodesulfovibrio sp.]